MKHVKIIFCGVIGGMALDATDGNVGSKELSFRMNRTPWTVVDTGSPHRSE